MVGTGDDKTKRTIRKGKRNEKERRKRKIMEIEEKIKVAVGT